MFFDRLSAQAKELGVTQSPTRPVRPQSTLRDVAAAAGVSVATASRVLSGSSATSASSREAVNTAAAELGFRPNSQARALRSSKTASIGLLIPDIRNPHFADLAHSVERRARERGLVTLISAADEQLEMQEDALRLLMSHNVDGLIVVPQGQPDSSEGSEALEAVARSGIPLVLVDRVVTGLDAPCVVPDTSGLEAAVATLAAEGHTRIALIAGPATSSTGRERREAFERALEKAGCSLDPVLVYEGDFQPNSGRQGIEFLLGLPRHQRPSAVMFADGPMAMGTMMALHERGVSIPRDLSVVAHDDLDAFKLCNPPLSAVAQDVKGMGATAVDVLLDPTSYRAGHAVRHPTYFVPRGSVSQPSTPRTDNHRKGGDDS